MAERLWHSETTSARVRTALGAAGGARGASAESVRSDLASRERECYLEDLAPGAAPVCQSSTTRTMRTPSPLPSLRKARSVFDLSPRLGSNTEEGFFSWSRWYGSSASPAEQVPPLPPSDEISRLVRDALRRRREAEDDSSLGSSSASSCASRECIDSPASSSGTWTTSASESSKGALPRTSGYEQEDLDALPTLAYAPDCPSPRLRAAQSASTLKAPRMLRRVSSSARISPVPVELPPHSPHSVTSPTLSTTMYDDDPFAALPPAPAFPPPPSLAQTPPASFRSRLASSLRKSASAATLRNPLRLSLASPGPEAPALPSVAKGPSAATILRDLLLKHDSAGDLSAEPLSPLFDPTLARFSEANDALGGFDPQQYLSSSSDDEGAAYPSSASDDDEAGEDDPFRAFAPARLAWMAPSSRAPALDGRGHDDNDLDSPSAAFTPFDPFALAAAFGPPPPLPFAPPSPPPPLRRPRAKVITRQRSFVDPRTRQLRTAPSVCVTPSTPEKKRFAGDDGEV
ncbi:hypothetical protein JCM3770_003316 [Rhodotorula araucariae]